MGSEINCDTLLVLLPVCIILPVGLYLAAPCFLLSTDILVNNTNGLPNRQCQKDSGTSTTTNKIHFANS